MRTYEERTAEAKRRIAAREHEKRLWHSKMAVISAAAACFMLLLGTSLAMPCIAARIQDGGDAGFETAAGIFHNSTALGYIIFGFLAFLLGVFVTILCFQLRKINRTDVKDPGSEERHGVD